LPSDDTDLDTPYSVQDYIDVATDDNVTVDECAIGGFNEHLFKNKNTNNTDNIQLTIRTQSELAPSLSTVYLQIYNRTTPGWETVDSDSVTAANTEFILTGSITSGLSNYYDINNYISCRVYQELV